MIEQFDALLAILHIHLLLFQCLRRSICVLVVRRSTLLQAV
jgi:hypothetical protein